MGTTSRPTPGTSVAVISDTPRQALTFSDFVKSLSAGNSIQSAAQLATIYDKAVDGLLGDGDVVIERDKQGKEIRIKKKSAWLKLGRYFHVDTHLVSVTKEWMPNGVFLCTVVKRGVAAWGQSTDAVGAASTDENRGRKKMTIADAIATADTRANNRAISNLIAQGEVSAEEIQRGGGTVEEEEAEGVTVEEEDAVTLTLDEANAMPWPWKGPPKYVGKTFADVSDRTLELIPGWYAEHEDAPNAKRILAAASTLLAHRREVAKRMKDVSAGVEETLAPPREPGMEPDQFPGDYDEEPRGLGGENVVSGR